MIAYLGCDVFDGHSLHTAAALVLEADVVVEICDPDILSADIRAVHLSGGTVLPGFVDLQANGGGGLLFNAQPDVAALRQIAAAHLARGTRAVLPTLITDKPEITEAAIDAVEAAIAEGVPGIVGLHLEGPHLDPRRHGAHDPALIRPMGDADLALLLKAAERLPNLKVTLAPESATSSQITSLAEAGVLVSLGHSDCTYEDARAAFAAGARCVTHLFNAMSPLSHRAPGLVGAALDCDVATGLIADAVHVHPTAMRAALAAKRGGEVFLVTDAMAGLGSDITEFLLNGRTVFRHDGRLTLQDGTLAGADLDMPRAVQVLCEEVGVAREEALRRATSVPASLIKGSAGLGVFEEGSPARAIHLARDGTTVTPLDGT